MNKILRQWRLLIDSPADGATNMAVDEAILEAVGEKRQLPTLRLYAWEPVCLSLGYGQRAADVDEIRRLALGWDIVRRPTGGRAILHESELTYSVALPQDDELVDGSIVESYCRLSGALLRALASLGTTVYAEQQQDNGENTPICFDTPSHYEITCNGKKLIGSAQVRRKGGVLQHGSLPLVGDISRICEVLVYADEAKREASKHMVKQRALTLEQALGRPITWEQAAQAVQSGFVEQFAIQFVFAGLSPVEQRRTTELRLTKYAEPQWTMRR